MPWREGAGVSGNGRIWTDPASVNHETDWGLWQWTGAGAIAVLATVGVVLGCSMAIWTARRGVDFAKNHHGESLRIPLAKLAAQGLASVVLCFAGVAWLVRVVHDMARHTAGMGWVLVLVTGVYALSYLAFWKLVPWLATFGFPYLFEIQDEGLWWKWLRRGALVLYFVLAVVNIVVEAFNKVSGFVGEPISMILFILALLSLIAGLRLLAAFLK